MGVGAEPAHRLGFAGDAFPAFGVEAVGLDEREGEVGGEQGVVGEVHALLPTLPQEALHLIAAVGEGHGGRRGGRLRSTRPPRYTQGHHDV